MNLRCIVVIASLLVLPSCASFYPLPLEEPSAYVKKDGQNVRRTPDYQRGGLFPATTIAEAIENLKIYGDTYQEYSDKLRRNEYVSNDTMLAGGVLGVIGGVAKSTETAITGVVLGSGASIVSERYQFLVQATNYEKASDAMYCIYGKLYPADEDIVTYQFINEKIDEIRRKLRKAQSTVQLVSPDLKELETSLSEVISGKEKQEIAKNKLVLKAANAETEFNEAQGELLEAEISKCVAAF